tara:strand:+ start:255 stop:743 length:489 start_codon:yes stop_codon:yes gene_type:complete
VETVYILENIFPKDQRLDLIKKSEPLLVEGDDINRRYVGRDYPGRQTDSRIHEFSYFNFAANRLLNLIKEKTGLDLVIDKSWVNWTNGKKSDIAWHTHRCDYAGVYYMKTTRFFSDGTLFKDRFVRVPLNGALIFPANILHTAPSCPFRIGRYTWAFNLNKR